jgi:hypothetical protein
MLPIIAIKGSAGELGFQYGARCQEMIQKNIQLYFRVFQHYAQLDNSIAARP